MATKPKLDYYVVNCEHCRDAFKEFGPRPLLARRYAERHARANTNHEAIVMNVRRLTIPWRYKFAQLTGMITDEKPPF